MFPVMFSQNFLCFLLLNSSYLKNNSNHILSNSVSFVYNSPFIHLLQSSDLSILLNSSYLKKNSYLSIFSHLSILLHSLRFFLFLHIFEFISFEKKKILLDQFFFSFIYIFPFTKFLLFLNIFEFILFEKKI